MAHYSTNFHNIKLMRFILVFLIVCTWLDCSIPPSVLGQWIPLPLRSERQNQSGMSGGEGMQQVTCFEYSPYDPNRIYMGVDTSGPWRSDDGGTSWCPIPNGFLALGAVSLAVHPREPDVVFCVGSTEGEHNITAQKQKLSQGVYRSTNGGGKWEQVKQAEIYKNNSRGKLIGFIRSKADSINPRDVLYVATAEQGVLFSQDLGNSWTKDERLPKRVIDAKQNPKHPEQLLILTKGGLYMYDQKELKHIGRGLPDECRTMSICESNPNILYVAGGKDGVFKSVNNGETFTALGHPFLAWPLDISDVAVSPADCDYCYAKDNLSSFGPFFSHDGGISWRQSSDMNLDNIAVSSGRGYYSSPFAPHPTNKLKAMTCTNGGDQLLMTSDGGKTWKFSGNGFQGGMATDFYATGPNVLYVCLTDHGVWRTTDGGLSFAQLPIRKIKGLTSCQSILKSGATLFVASGSWDEHQIQTSSDDGVSWKVNDRIILNRGERLLTFDDESERAVCAGTNFSIDHGKTWSASTNPILCIGVGERKSLYTVRKTNQASFGLAKSDDLGSNWVDVGDPLPFGKETINQMAVVEHGDNERAYFATSNGFWLMDEGGKFQRRDALNGLANDAHGLQYAKCLAVNSNNIGQLFVGRYSIGYGRSNGVFVSNDQGMTWQSYNDNLQSGLDIMGMYFNPFTNVLYIGTPFGTYYRSVSQDKIRGKQ